MARKKISTTIYITPEQNEQLKLLNSKTRVPVAEYIRQGIDLVLEGEAAKVTDRASWSRRPVSTARAAGRLRSKARH